VSEFNAAPQWARVADAAICYECGALVWDRVTHERWHAALTPVPVPPVAEGKA
jgi:hypothetical protein